MGRGTDDTMISQLLAHQGGWDEILLVAGPLAVFGGALMVANKRANAKLAEQAAAEETGAETDDD